MLPSYLMYEIKIKSSHILLSTHNLSETKIKYSIFALLIFVYINRVIMFEYLRTLMTTLPISW